MSSVTVTSTSGPGFTVTALVINNVSEVKFDIAREVLYVTTTDGPNIKEFALDSVTSVTFTISGKNYTIAVS